MSVKISETVQQNLAEILNNVMATSELVNCIVVTRTGLKIAPDVTADTFSASSSALIDLGERVVGSLQHGTLQEMVINALGGYVILVAIGHEYMLLGSTSAALKMGYYLPFLRKNAWDMENIIYGESATTGTGIEESVEPRSPEKVETPSAPAITMETIKAADMKAMDDVLAAFDEFGIDDEFTKGMEAIEVPSVGISVDEM
nr:roadblock/LC7 domain-containing protein [Candidatus Sigynarchaeota archaeon]